MFRNGSYATIWGVEKDDRGNVNVELSTSRKDKKTNEYVTDFSYKFVRFFGEAGDRAMRLRRGDRIKITECGVGNSYNKEKKQTYWNPFVFDFEDADAGASKSRDTSNFDGDWDEDDDLPL